MAVAGARVAGGGQRRRRPPLRGGEGYGQKSTHQNSLSRSKNYGLGKGLPEKKAVAVFSLTVPLRRRLLSTLRREEQRKEGGPREMGTRYCRSPAVAAPPPARATYVTLYRWPESDAEFVRSVGSGGGAPPRRPALRHQPPVVDGYSCRQMYLRSYTFSKRETLPERARKCLVKVKESVAGAAVSASCGFAGRRTKAEKKCPPLVAAALNSISRRLLSCTASLNVAVQ